VFAVLNDTNYWAELSLIPRCQIIGVNFSSAIGVLYCIFSLCMYFKVVLSLLVGWEQTVYAICRAAVESHNLTLFITILQTPAKNTKAQRIPLLSKL